MIPVSPKIARRMAVLAQRLAGPRPEPSAEGMLEVVRQLGCLQLDPISAVARSHQLVLWSRVGNYQPADFETLMWERRQLFEYWAPAWQAALRSNTGQVFPVAERTG